MKKTILVLLILTMLVSNVFASDPSLDSITHNKIYAGTQTTFTTNITPDGQNGNVRFYVQNNLINQFAFTPSDTQIDFLYNWTNSGDQNIYFTIADYNTDTNIQNNRIDKSIYIWKGLDITPTNITLTPQNPSPGETVQMLITIKNIGDENFVGIIPIEISLDNNVLGEINTTGIYDNEKTVAFNFDLPLIFVGSHQLKVRVNPTNTIHEFDYINNTYTLSMNGADEIDLTIDSIVVPDSIRKGGLVNVDVAVKNGGGISAENVQLTVFYVDEEEELIYDTFITSIGANSTKSINFVNIFPNIGDFILKAVVDRNNSISEAIETNNELSLEINVFDWNLDTILEENDSYRQQLIEKTGLIESLYNQIEERDNSIANLDNEVQKYSRLNSECEADIKTIIDGSMFDWNATQHVFQTTLQSDLHKCNTDLSEVRNSCNARVDNEVWTSNTTRDLLFLIILCIVAGIFVYNNRDKIFPSELTSILYPNDNESYEGSGFE